MPLRDHDSLVLESFNGLWDRGDNESAPSDHFIQADNVQYFNSGFETRYPLDKYQTIPPLTGIIRMYDYVLQTGQSLLVLTKGGKIYHCIGPDVIHGPILTIPNMEDFGFVAIAGRAYITPFKTYQGNQGVNYQLGIQNQFLYVYKGDGTPARKAAGTPPIGSALSVTHEATAGKTDTGIHLIAIVYETDTGHLTALGPAVFGQLDYNGLFKILVSNIPVSPDPYVARRHIVSTKAIPEYNGDQTGYQFFFIPDGEIKNNIDTYKVVEYYDADLLSDASHLIDNFSEIPAGVSLTTYHSRLVIVGEYGTTETLTGLPEGIIDNRSIARLSAPGEPEAISKIDGLLVTPLDGNPLTNCQEFRDILYLFKRTRTLGYSDNGDEPSSWQEEVIDQGIGAPVHGIATVLDSGSVNVDFLLVADLSGLLIFNGTYARPELSWKIEDQWNMMVKNNFHYIQLVNDSISKKIWMTVPPPYQQFVFHADYGNGLDPKNIKWARWIFNTKMSSLVLIEINKLIVGALENV